jgi:alanine racemase
VTRACRAVINLTHLSDNLAMAKRLAKSAQCIPVIKSNAYGHGLIEVARHLSQSVSAFAVACCDEARQLREAGIKTPLLLLEGPFSIDEITYATTANCWLVIQSQQQLDMLQSITVQLPLKVFVKVDSGMHRLGFQPAEINQVIAALKGMPQVDDSLVLMSHFACADQLNHPLTSQQIDVINAIRCDFGGDLCLSNSAAIIQQLVPDDDWVRPGIMLYGGNPFDGVPPEGLLAVMSLQSEIIALRSVGQGDTVGYGASWVAQRTSNIATIACGYGDGYPRNLPSGTPVWVDGHLCPLVGRVSMDMITVDVTDHPAVAVGAPVELWGEHVSVNDIAKAAGTISYELLAAMPARPPRYYIS